MPQASSLQPHARTCRTGGGSSPAATGTSSPGMKLRLMPSLLMTTVRMQPPLEPSRAMACDTALTTNALHSSSLMLGCTGGRAAEARAAGLAEVSRKAGSGGVWSSKSKLQEV